MNKNTAKQTEVTLHILGEHVMWGVPKSPMEYSEDFALAANANVEHGAMPVVAERKPRTVNANVAETEIVVRLFGKK